jgi:hypothetical protein
MSAKQVPL